MQQISLLTHSLSLSLPPSPCSLFFSVPLSCSLFPQLNSMKTSNLEQSAQDEIKAATQGQPPERVYFNKGL